MFWMERLGYFWHKNPRDREHIERIINRFGDSLDWNDEFHVGHISKFYGSLYCGPSIEDTDEEVVGFING